MVIYGIHAVREALSADLEVKKVFISGRRDRRVDEILSLAEKKGILTVRKNREFFREISARTSQLVAAEVDIRSVGFDDLIRHHGGENAIFLAIDQVEDPRNLGAIIRSAAAVGVNGVILQSHRSCKITSTVFSASAGTVAHVTIAEVPNIKNALRTFREAGYRVIGTDSSAESLYWEKRYEGPLVLVMGSEGTGLRKTVKQLCDFMVKIPMDRRVSSLNVSVASGIVLYEIFRQKNS